jgi:hypothetical protein
MFFKHEDLSVLSAFHRLCYVGLWCHADREGRLEDRPRRLKAEIFPYDDVDMETLLSDLCKAGFIQRYRGLTVAPSRPDRRGSVALPPDSTVDVIWIPSFLKHQVPRKEEHPSVLPAGPPPINLSSSVPLPRSTDSVEEPTRPDGPSVSPALVGSGEKDNGKKDTQISTAALPPFSHVVLSSTQRNGLARRPSEDGNYAVVANVARRLLGEHDFENESELVDAVKDACAAAKIDYGRHEDVPFDVVHRACASEWFKHRHPEMRRRP